MLNEETNDRVHTIMERMASTIKKNKIAARNKRRTSYPTVLVYCNLEKEVKILLKRY